MQPRILRLNDVIEATRLSRSTIISKVKRGQFPPPFKLSPGINAWEREDIERWVDDTIREAKKQATA